MRPSLQTRGLFQLAGLKALPSQWRVGLGWLGLVWAGLLAAFASDWGDMAGQWWNSSTYSHILLIPPVLIWLVLQRVGQVLLIEPRPWWPGLIFFGVAAFIWLLGDFVGLAIARHFGVVALLVASFLTLLGPRVGAGLTFPLCYMFLLVPFGDELVPRMQMITASITTGLIDLSGVPARIDGVFIATPAGLFEVAEACSGVKFLIAMIAFGLLAANICFVSWRRRLLFLLACIVAPVLANGIRAFATIYAAQLVGAEAAVGFDHIVYGWIFFALVLIVIVLGAWRYFDRSPDDLMIDADKINGSPVLGRLATLDISRKAALGGLVVMVLASLAWSRAGSVLEADMPDRIALPDVRGWQRVDYNPSVWWEPRASGSDHRLLGRYADAEGREVDVFIALYSAQGESREAGGFGEGALPGDQSWAWLSPGPPVGYGKSERLLANGSIERLAQTWYRTGDMLTGSNVRLKLANMQDRLLFRVHPTTMLILSSEEQNGRPAVEAIAAFRNAVNPLGKWMDRITRVE